jgi:histidine triad (HIT) family protein
MAQNDCIFCKIVAGQIKAQVVYDDPQVLAFRDVNPQAPVHILVIPKKHIQNISQVSETDTSLVGHMAKTAVEVARRENVQDSGFRLVANNGPHAGQSVDHLHMHVLGGRKLAWPPG